MTAAFDERPVDPKQGSPVPFACEYDDGRVDQGTLNRKRVIQCALSRICGMCGDSLTWPVAFVGSAAEADANAFTYPPLHVQCAERALDLFGGRGDGFLGRPVAPAEWAFVTTGGFELERPANRTGDQRLRFHPNSISDDRRSST
ncbi:MAG: hypothetical protein ACR2K2_04650 [Mycobacteriales bacterium]